MQNIISFDASPLHARAGFRRAFVFRDRSEIDTMSSDRLLEEFPGSKDDLGIPQPGSPTGGGTGGKKPNKLVVAWDGLSRLGLGEAALRIGTHALSIILLIVVIWALRAFYLYLQDQNVSVVPVQQAVFAAAEPSPTPVPPVRP